MNGVLLIRHGALPPNPERRFIGARDIPLSDAGRMQVRRLALELAAEIEACPAAIVSSDLSRCRETAAILADALACATKAIPLHTDSKLREINLGLWQGLTPVEVEQKFPGQFAGRGRDMANFCPPQGESFMQVQERALSALAHWRKQYHTGLLLLVTHAGVIRTILACHLALPLTELLRIPQHYACTAFLGKGDFRT